MVKIYQDKDLQVLGVGSIKLQLFDKFITIWRRSENTEALSFGL